MRRFVYWLNCLLRSSRRRASDRQSVLPFLERAERLDRVFRRTIVVATAMLAIGLIGLVPAGRSLARRAWIRASALPDAAVSLTEPRAAFERRRTRERLAACDDGRRVLADIAASGSDPMRRFLARSAMDSETAVVRWGNYDQVLALSGRVFEPDDRGRSYRPRPETSAVWAIGLSFAGVGAMFLVPDEPAVREAAQAAGAQVIDASAQRTNSWGCRGAEPDSDAPIRGLVLGDSCMQGALIGDEQTPPARLEARLAEALGERVSVLNTGVLGYSPEQEYATLVGYGDRFRPQFVIVSVCSNDFGDMRRRSNWDETAYWLDRITQYCRTREWICLVVPVTNEDEMLGRRDLSVYPGQVSRILGQGGAVYVDPLEAFTNEHLRLRVEAEAAGRGFSTSPLFNRHLRGDQHFSALGADLWAREVARRLLLVWSSRALSGVGAPAAVERFARGGFEAGSERSGDSGG